MKQPSYIVKTLGCKANLYDSQLLEAELQKRGWVAASGSSEEGLRLCIVNSCTVTDEADRQSRRMASRLSRENPNARVVVTGCSAEVDPERLAASKGIHYVVANRDKPKLVEMILTQLEKGDAEEDAAGQGAAAGRVLGVAEGYSEMVSRHPMDREWPAPEAAFAVPSSAEGGESDRTRAFLKIQDGCNSFCTYCVIPYGRGPSRSLTIPEVVDQVSGLVSQGTREVVITGINIGDYGVDWSEAPAVAQPFFGARKQHQVVELFEALLARTGLERLRVSSLDPTEITPEMISLMEREPRFCPHFHVSLQSPVSSVLKRMKRKYGAPEVEQCLSNIGRIPAPLGGVFVGMDVITGFPGESEEEFQATYEILARLPWSRLHVFPYSERKGTPATRLPNAVPQQERVRRCKVLRELSYERLTGICQEVLKTCRERNRVLDSVLLEGAVRGPDGTRNWISGYTRNYLRVLIPVGSEAEVASLSNQLVSVVPEQIIGDPAAGDVAFIARTIS